MKGASVLKHLTLESKEFKRVMQNLHLENLNLPLEKQKRILKIVNSGAEITPSLIKDLMEHEDV
ncbi:hypothetical protein GCM10028778_12550 [Barrientosiimonas marina]